ncbi:hypothetical protein [Faecalimicrobium dakarense]|uniref:hypothetical protein n=1 Tax=Faecalimicrobium dakarense TaxID=1301100 RepID=UPI0004B7636B|nr:hypothetical protein [[Clostridium] dakarense]
MKKFSKIILCLCILIFFTTGCSKSNEKLEKVNINDIKNNEKMTSDMIYNVSYIIKNPTHDKYTFKFSLESDKGNLDLGELYSPEQTSKRKEDILITLSVSKNENDGYKVTRGASIVKDNKIIDAGITKSDFNEIKDKEISFEDIKVENKEITNNKVPIVNIKSKDNKDIGKISLKIEK